MNINDTGMKNQYLIDNYGDEINVITGSLDDLFGTVKNINTLRTAYNSAVQGVLDSQELPEKDKVDILEQINRFTNWDTEYDEYLNSAIQSVAVSIKSKIEKLFDIYDDLMDDYTSITNGKTWGQLRESGDYDMAMEINEAALEIYDICKALERKANKINKQTK